MTLPTKGAEHNKYAMINQGMVAISTCLKMVVVWIIGITLYFIFIYLLIYLFGSLRWFPKDVFKSHKSQKGMTYCANILTPIHIIKLPTNEFV